MAVTPSVPAKTNLVLGDGILYKDYNEATEVVIGAVRGDSVFNVDRQFRNQGYNGSYGDTKGLKVKTRVQPTFNIALLELSTTNMVNCYQGIAMTDETNYYELEEGVDVNDSDYWTNMAFVGVRSDLKPIIIIMDNVLGDGALNMAFKDKDDVVVNTLMTAHYGEATPITPPYRIRYNKAV